MRRVWLTSLVLFLATFAVFSRVLFADFVRWDDDISVYQNPHIQGLDWGRLCWMFSDTSYGLRYEPLHWLGYALIHRFNGLKPVGYHSANLLLHCLNTVLLFLVIRRILAAGSTGGRIAGGLDAGTFPAAVGTLMWAANPLRVEPVAHVTDLRYCLLLFFLLLSLWFYMRAHQDGTDAPGQRCFYWCSVTAFALSMLSLPFACGFGVVLAALDWYPLRRFEGCSRSWLDARARKVLLEKLPFLLLGGLILVTILGRFNPTGTWVSYQPDSNTGLFSRAMQALYVWAYYAWKPWLPLHLSPVYTTLVGFNPNAWFFWLSAAFVIGTTVVLVCRRSQWPWALALWVSHLVLLIPALGLTERPHFAADRYDYLPGLVWGVAIAAALRSIGTWRRLRAVGLALGIALTTLWGGLSWHQTRIWRNSIALFEYVIHELKDDPYRSDIQWRLGAALAVAGRTQEALEQYQGSLRIQPAWQCHVGLAELLKQKEDWQGALTNYLAAVALRPDPLDHAKAGEVLARLGRSGEAIGQYRQALALNPDLVPALNNLAWILASDREGTNRNGAEAVRLAERACALTDYRKPALMNTLAAAYAEAGRYDEAVGVAQKACELAEAAGQHDVAERNRQAMKLYRSRQPYRAVQR